MCLFTCFVYCCLFVCVFGGNPFTYAYQGRKQDFQYLKDLINTFYKYALIFRSIKILQTHSHIRSKEDRDSHWLTLSHFGSVTSAAYSPLTWPFPLSSSICELKIPGVSQTKFIDSCNIFVQPENVLPCLLQKLTSTGDW